MKCDICGEYWCQHVLWESYRERDRKMRELGIIYGSTSIQAPSITGIGALAAIGQTTWSNSMPSISIGGTIFQPTAAPNKKLLLLRRAI